MIKKILLVIVAIIVIGLLIPQNLKMPVVGVDSNSYNHNAFWHGGWGSSVVHKGVDIFAKKGASINSSTVGIVLTTGEGAKVVNSFWFYDLNGDFITMLI